MRPLMLIETIFDTMHILFSQDNRILRERTTMMCVLCSNRLLSDLEPPQGSHESHKGERKSRRGCDEKAWHMTQHKREGKQNKLIN